MEKLIHGGDIYSHADKKGRLLDFSANINPLGMPDEVKQALVSHVEEYACYPDPLCRSLRAAIGTFHRIPAEDVLCGNGAADLIFRVCWGLRPKKALVLAPTFAEYELALRSCGCEVSYFDLDRAKNFLPDINALCRQLSHTEGLDLVFLCNPNNPTGLALKREEVSRIGDACREKGGLLVVDECFADFLEREEEYSVLEDIREGRLSNVLVLRAFTKMYAMAGVRLGYLISSCREALRGIGEAGQPWSVSTVASVCGEAALSCRAHVEKSRLLAASGRAYLTERLALLGFRMFPSMVNFLLFQCPEAGLKEGLEKEGILIRSCANYRGLDGTYFRIAVKSEEDNRRLVETVKKLLS